MENSALTDYILHFSLCPRIDVKFISCFHKVADHGFPHNPYPDKANLFHISSPSL